MMKIRLMDQRGEWNPLQKQSPAAVNNRIDLELNEMFAEMARGDTAVLEVVQTAFLSPLAQAEQILYRQQVLSDCLDNRKAVRSLYALAREALMRQESPSLRFGEMQSISSQFERCLSRLEDLFATLRSLRDFAREQEKYFRSQGFQSLFQDLKENLDEPFFAGLEELLEQLQFGNGMLIGANLTASGGSIGHTLLYLEPGSTTEENRPFYEVAQEDVRGQSDLIHRRETAISKSNRILVRAISFVCDYLRALKNNLAFYIGCLNLHQSLTMRGMALCIPAISPREYGWLAEGLTELNIALKAEHPVANDLHIANDCCIITGADLGGKTTFLRSIGQSQMMLQCGMFVTARSFSAPVSSGIFTHFQREEDTELLHGKLGEELTRMSGIIDHIAPRALLLCDESFCSTSEREGSELAWQVTQALRERGISVFMATHLFPFARRIYEQSRNDSTFLCSERLPDGTRTWRILPGPPQRTSFSEDLYQEVFDSPSDRDSI